MPQPPVIVHVIGGLGNQMFQYAAGRALAARLGRPLVLDTSDFARYPLRAFALDRFAAPIEQATRRYRWLARAGRTPLRFVLPAGLRVVHVREQTHAYQPWPPIPAASPVFLSGYWQSERYFAEIAPVIRRDFTVATPATGRNADLLTEIARSSAVAVHVRRGDYVSDPTTAAYHGTCGVDYYCAALERIEAAVSEPRYFVCSDDIPWARDNLRFRHPATFIDHNAAAPWEDLRLLAACRHFVIANSSFSWWAAWLAEHPAEATGSSVPKLVIAPRRWFVAAEDDRDRLPTSWIRL